MRQRIVAVLILILTLTSVGQGFAAASSAGIGPTFGLPGVSTPICHAGTGGGSPNPDPSHHDCCDACAFLNTATLPEPPALSAPAPVAHFAAHEHAIAWMPAVARPRTPRQSQGPPAA